MAFPTGVTIDAFDSTTPQELLTINPTTATVAVNGFSASGQTVEFENTANASEMVVVFSGTFASAPIALTRVGLYLKYIEIDGTLSSPDPSANFQHQLVGSFPMSNLATITSIPIAVPLANVKPAQKMKFFIKNETAEILQAGWKLLGSIKGYTQSS